MLNKNTTMKIKRNLSITLAAVVAALSAITVGAIRPAHADLTGPKPPKVIPTERSQVNVNLVEASRN